jgi:hypothetical protein
MSSGDLYNKIMSTLSDHCPKNPNGKPIGDQLDETAYIIRMLSTTDLGPFSRSYICKDDTKLFGKKFCKKHRNWR